MILNYKSAESDICKSNSHEKDLNLEQPDVCDCCGRNFSSKFGLEFDELDFDESHLY